MLKSTGDRQQARDGFTLVELLVVITIIGILMGLLIPAVQAARETARRNQCSTQINNLAKAAIQYEMSHKGFPGWVNDFGNYVPPTATGVAVDPSDPENTTATAAAHEKIGSWVVSLLPSLDAQPTYEIWTQDQYPLVTTDAGVTEFTENSAPNLAIMQCPSSPSLSGNAARNSYVANCGMYNLTTPVLAATPAFVVRSNNDTITGAGSASPANTTITYALAMKKDNGVFNNQFARTSSTGPRAVGDRVRLDDMKDGGGNTVLVSENLQAIPWHRLHFNAASAVSALNLATADNLAPYPSFAQLTQGFVWHYEDEPSDPSASTGFNGSPKAKPIHKINGISSTEDIYLLDMGANDAHDLARPSSAHTDGVNMGFADGGSRFINQTIDYRLYQALMTPRGKSSDVPFRQYVIKGEAL